MIERVHPRIRDSFGDSYTTDEVAAKLNEVIDELNRREEVPTDTTVACSDCNTNAHTFLCCPERYPKESAKREEQSPLIQELTRNQAYAIEEAKQEAVEAYKKRLVEDIQAESERGAYTLLERSTFACAIAIIKGTS